ncbi:hypothetical protein B0T19DRAFT_193940 [Cercophora scortea]|uniref:Uncharacterized protein n=1 Tax=Cercophora scortea TaxID=314031 RepID=A0AAE0INX4_9PEZI|nr:hypothetical protein B0T19DRAFT_193940 [Cercophora scortea]
MALSSLPRSPSRSVSAPASSISPSEGRSDSDYDDDDGGDDDDAPGSRSHSRSRSRSRSRSQSARPRGREINVYDAVAGRVAAHEPLRSPGGTRVTAPRRISITGFYASYDARLAPEEVLFRKEHAPDRYAENDIYWANEDLPDAGRHVLPDSDLLKSTHSYASKFYDAMAHRLGPSCLVGSRTIDERSMDETALLAFGILLEEAGREAPGKRGHLVLTEAELDDMAVTKPELSGSPSDIRVSNSSTTVGPDGEDGLGRKKRPKRRKVAKEDYVQESGI